MQISRPIVVDPTKILSRRELAAVLADLTQKAPRSANTWMNLVLVQRVDHVGVPARGGG